MTAVRCNLCGADDYVVRFEAGVAQVNQIVSCKRCSLMYANPRAAEPDHVVVESWKADDVEQWIAADDPRLMKESLQVRDYASTRRFLAGRHPQRGKLLEVGSGFGYLLSYFRDDGWQVLGVEPNAGLNRHAQKTLKLDVVSAILPDAKIESDSMDAVLMMHVIEHVPDPLDTLQEIHRILRPRGTLVIETPRYDTLMFKLLGRRERSLSCDGHIYFFTTATLSAIAKTAGFRVLRANRVGRSLTLSRFVYNLGVMSRSQRVKRGLESLVNKLGMEQTSMTLNLRDMERVCLEKAP